MDRGGLADRPVKLAEAASLSDDPWYGQRLEALARELAVSTREVLGIYFDDPPGRGLLGALFAGMRRSPVAPRQHMTG